MPDSTRAMITFEAMLKARERIAPHIFRTPLVRSDFLSDLTGGEVYLKLECQQRLNAFKVRGMLNRVLTLTPAERKKGVIVCTSGNHGIAASYCGQRWGIEVEVFTPTITPPAKIERMRRFGAKVRVTGSCYDESYALMKEYLREVDKVYVDSSADEIAASGYGSIACEILEDNPDIDAFLIPVGGGGLVTGVGLAVRALRPKATIYGVQTEACPSMVASLRDHVFYETYPSAPSVCEGLLGGVGELGYRYSSQTMDGMVTVTEAGVRRAMIALLRYDRVVVEGSGAVGPTYVMEHPETLCGKQVAIILSGGNVNFRVLAQEIHDMLAAGQAPGR